VFGRSVAGPDATEVDLLLRASIGGTREALIVAVSIESGAGEQLAMTELEAPLEELRKQHKVIPDTLVAALDIDPATLALKKTARPPTDSTLALLYYFAARRAHDAGDRKGALSLLDKAVVVDASFAMAHWSAAELHAEEDAVQQADRRRRRAQEIDPDHPRWPMADVAKQARFLPNLMKLLAASEERVLHPGLWYRSVRAESYGVRLDAVRVDPARLRVSVREQRDVHGSTLSAFLEAPSDLFSVNGGFFHIDSQHRLTPSGLVVVDGVQRAPLSDAGSGVFTVSPSGVDIVSREAAGVGGHDPRPTVRPSTGRAGRCDGHLLERP